jgi:hypothetical protein
MQKTQIDVLMLLTFFWYLLKKNDQSANNYFGEIYRIPFEKNPKHIKIILLLLQV